MTTYHAAFDAELIPSRGFKHYYGNAEKNMVDFLQKRDEIFLISKGFVASDTDWDETITVEQEKGSESLDWILR